MSKERFDKNIELIKRSGSMMPTSFKGMNVTHDDEEGTYNIEVQNGGGNIVLKGTNVIRLAKFILEEYDPLEVYNGLIEKLVDEIIKRIHMLPESIVRSHFVICSDGIDSMIHDVLSYDEVCDFFAQGSGTEVIIDEIEKDVNNREGWNIFEDHGPSGFGYGALSGYLDYTFLNSQNPGRNRPGPESTFTEDIRKFLGDMDEIQPSNNLSKLIIFGSKLLEAALGNTNRYDNPYSDGYEPALNFFACLDQINDKRFLIIFDYEMSCDSGSRSARCLGRAYDMDRGEMNFDYLPMDSPIKSIFLVTKVFYKIYKSTGGSDFSVKDNEIPLPDTMMKYYQF